MMKSKILFAAIFFSVVGIGFTFWHFQTTHDKARTIARTPSSDKSDSKTVTKTDDSTRFLQPKTQPGTQDSKIAYQFNNITEYEKASRYGKLPSLFKGMNVFLKLSDGDGNLVITRNIRDLFDYFFLALNEEGMETVTGRIREYIQLTLQGKAANEALSIFEDYLDYRNALSELRSSYKSTDDKTAIFAELKALRRQYFQPEVVTAFFSDEEADIHYSLQSMKVKTNDSLSQEQKEEMLAKLEDQLPEKQRERIRREREEQKLDQQIKELQAQGGNADEIYKLRKDFYGEAIAKQITFMYDFSNEWNNRVDDYTQAKEKIKANPDLTDEEKKERIKAATDEKFTKKEQLKLAYYELKKQLPQKE